MLSGIPVRFESGAVIFRQGDGAADLYLIRTGSVRIVRTDSHGERVLAELGPGSFFGEMAIFDPGPRSATATAATDVELEAVDRGSFLAAMDEPDVQEMLAEMARRIRELGLEHM
ncbi:MAG: cyclic nucleotide-binding domain-containing protein [Actinobacteria bacterium]|nr:cyclic nucleotide-binding domain-containing protein [Actinomycetota bacterium]